MSKKKAKKDPKKAPADSKKAKKPSAGSTKAPKKQKPKADSAAVLAPPVDFELEVLDEVELAALEEYRRTVALNRARKEEPSQEEAVIEADGWQFDMVSSTFSLQLDSQPIAQLAMDEESLRTLVQGINSAYILPDDEPPSYQVRIPDLYDAPPVLSLIKGGAVVGSLALDEDFNERVGSLLQARYPQEPQEPAWDRFKAWVKAHKIRTGFLILLAIPVLVLLVEGAYNSILASFS